MWTVLEFIPDHHGYTILDAKTHFEGVDQSDPNRDLKLPLFVGCQDRTLPVTRVVGSMVVTG